MRPRQEQGDDGAIAILVAILIVVLIGFTALALDISSQVAKRQGLQNTLDAAALAAAGSLPSMVNATQAVNDYVAANDPTLTPVPAPTFWCIVASTGVGKTADASQIPGVCNPGAAPYTPTNYPGLTCDEVKCFIPCTVAKGCSAPNAVTLAASRPVNFLFAPVFGISQGGTGAVSATACKDGCGAVQPNPLDVMVVADRTMSMADRDRASMVDAIKSMLGVMDQKSQFVALATLVKSKPTSKCPTASASSFDESGATWVPTPFSATYQTSATDNLMKSLTCLPGSDYGGTDLASSMKAAARYLLGKDPNNIGALPLRSGTPRKILIFETDGRPQVDNDKKPPYAGTSSLDSAPDIAYSDGGKGVPNAGVAQACADFTAVANNAKAAGVLVITIGFGGASTNDCNANNKPAAVLAAAASGPSPGVPSVASDCSTAAGRTAENGDGDYFFCAATGQDMSSIFVTAINQVTGKTKLIKPPA